jgi:hypothetical protein
MSVNAGSGLRAQLRFDKKKRLSDFPAVPDRDENEQAVRNIETDPCRRSVHITKCCRLVVGLLQRGPADWIWPVKSDTVREIDILFRDNGA